MEEKQGLNIHYVSLAKLKPYKNNPRKNDKAVDFVKNSIEQFGWRVPIVIDRNMIILAGHTRYKAAKRLGIEMVPCVVADDLSEEQAAAFRLIDNKTQELSSWDFGKLIQELNDLVDEFRMSMFGFDDKEDDDGGEVGRVATQDLDEGEELDIEDFSDGSFNCQCPFCGFWFND